MTTWRLDIDEAAIYCGDKRVAALASDCSNDGWREACRVGQNIVGAMNGADRAGFEDRMRAEGHSQTALTRTKSGGYLSPTVQSEWRSALDAASYMAQENARLRVQLDHEFAHSAAEAEDAARYRWLRDGRHDWWDTGVVKLHAGPDYSRAVGEYLDAAIDAAMKP